MYVCMSICVYVCMSVCMSVCVCVCVCARVFVRSRIIFSIVTNNGTIHYCLQCILVDKSWDDNPKVI